MHTYIACCLVYVYIRFLPSNRGTLLCHIYIYTYLLVWDDGRESAYQHQRCLLPVSYYAAMQWFWRMCQFYVRIARCLMMCTCYCSFLWACIWNSLSYRNRCQCTPPNSGFDCSLNADVAPTITALGSSSCDIRGVGACPVETLSVSGSNFLPTQNLSCRFNGTVVKAVYLGSGQVLCQLPTPPLLSDPTMSFLVSVSNNGLLWSTGLPFVFYDSNCVLCGSSSDCM